MTLPVGFKKRLEALEYRLDPEGSRALKVFIYHPEEDLPFWDPEPPEAWQMAYPKGHAIILEVRDIGI